MTFISAARWNTVVGGKHPQPEAAMRRHDSSRPIVLETLGKLAAHRHAVGGYYLDCAATYGKELLPTIERPATFSVDMGTVIAATLAAR